ncbi:MAG: Hint domain-containing protein, partial [Paracoccaceae bacterium]
MPSPLAFRLDPAFALAPLRPAPQHGRRDCGMASDALVETEAGWVRAGEVTPGMRIATFDGGFSPVTGIVRRGAGDAGSPAVLIPPGALGNCEGLTVAAGQEILLPTGAAEKLLDAAFALVPAQVLSGFFGAA